MSRQFQHVELRRYNRLLFASKPWYQRLWLWLKGKAP